MRAAANEAHGKDGGADPIPRLGVRLLKRLANEQELDWKDPPVRGHLFFTQRPTEGGCNTISKNSRKLCNNGALVEEAKGKLRLCATHAGMLRAGWSFYEDPQDSGNRRW